MTGSTDFKVTGALLGLTLLVGGAGVSYPILQLLMNCAAVGAFTYFSVRPANKLPGGLDRWAFALITILLLLPLAQLIPLPPSLWQALPGRELPKQLDGALGWSLWRPWTLDIEGTMRSWLVMIPAAVLLWGCLRLNVEERQKLLWIVVAFALLNAFLGVVQLASGGDFTPYSSAHRGYPIGWFVNRNHSASYMLAAMPILAALGASRISQLTDRTPVMVAVVSALTVLAMVAIGTTSRMGLAMLPVAVISSIIILTRQKSPKRLALPGLIGVGALGLAFSGSAAFQRSIARFSPVDEARFGFWNDLVWAIQHYGLAGTGLGTFVPVFRTAESLETISPAFVNHAHNDYLEVALELGAFGVLLLIGWAVLAAVAIVGATRRRATDHRLLLRFACAAALIVFVLSSSVDYPLRMPAVAGTSALLFACILPTSASARTRSRKRYQGAMLGPIVLLRSGRAAAVAAAAAILIISLQAAMSARDMINQRFDSAARWAPWSTRAQERLSTATLSQSQLHNAADHAKNAVRLSPISAPGIRTIGVVRLLSGARDGDRFMQIAAELGWRDSITQLWSIEAAQRSGEPVKALQRAEALFRQDTFAAPALAQLLRAPQSQHLIPRLVLQLAKRPQWRSPLLRAGALLTGADAEAFRRLAGDLSRSAAPVTSAEVGPAIKALVGRGKIREAQQLWAAVHPGNLVNNGGFDTVQLGIGRALPAEWDIPGENAPALAVAFPTFDHANRALVVGDTPSLNIISQKLLLAPGAYRLRFRAHVDNKTAVSVEWRLSCKDSPQIQRTEMELPATKQWHQAQIAIAVPVQDCPMQTLALRRRASDNADNFWVDQIDLRTERR